MSRETAYRKGLWAEALAALLLTCKGYRILARRHRSPVGEIDIVAVRRRRLVFVEVKVRGTIEAAAHAVTAHQQRRIARAAEHWLAQSPRHRDHDIAFDVVLLAPWTWPRHLQAAFRI
ncbi:MAG: YraN family protein [Methyloligellaceae bacterium]